MCEGVGEFVKVCRDGRVRCVRGKRMYRGFQVG